MNENQRIEYFNFLFGFKFEINYFDGYSNLVSKIDSDRHLELHFGENENDFLKLEHLSIVLFETEEHEIIEILDYSK